MSWWESLIALVASVVGDYVLGKWIARLQLWWATKASQALRAVAEAEYTRLQAQFVGLKPGERPDGEKK